MSCFSNPSRVGVLLRALLGGIGSSSLSGCCCSYALKRKSRRRADTSENKSSGFSSLSEDKSEAESDTAVADRRGIDRKKGVRLLPKRVGDINGRCYDRERVVNPHSLWTSGLLPMCRGG